MSDFTPFLTILFLAIIPGFIAMTIILDNIITKKFKPFNFVLYSIIIGFLSYLFLDYIEKYGSIVLNCLFHTQIAYNKLAIWSLINVNTTTWTINLKEVILSSIISLIISVIIIIFINHKFINRFLRYIHMSYKFGDESLYYFYLNSNLIEWVYLRDHENALIYQGQVQSYSEDGKYQEIVLSNVSVYNNEKIAELLYKVPSLYLSREYGKITIEQIPQDLFKSNNEKK